MTRWQGFLLLLTDVIMGHVSLMYLQRAAALSEAVSAAMPQKGAEPPSETDHHRVAETDAVMELPVVPAALVEIAVAAVSVTLLDTVAADQVLTMPCFTCTSCSTAVVDADGLRASCDAHSNMASGCVSRLSHGRTRVQTARLQSQVCTPSGAQLTASQSLAQSHQDRLDQ